MKTVAGIMVIGITMLAHCGAAHVAGTDKTLVEVFANDRQAAVTAGKYIPENLAGIVFSEGGDSVVKQIKAWQMKSIYPVKSAPAGR